MGNETRVTQVIRVPLKECERVMATLRKLGAIDPGFTPKVEGEFLLIPVLDQRGLQRDAQLGSLKLVSRQLRARARRPRSIKEALSLKLKPDEVDRITRSFDIVGDIAVISPRENTSHYKDQVVDALLSVHPNVRMVLAKVSPLSGKERVASYERWYGSGTTETQYREHGCVYHLDLTKTFFTPRLSTERKRVASLVEPDETVCDLFAGVGPFSVLMAKVQPASRVKACDISPEAIAYLRANVRLNGVSDRVEIFLGDAREESRTSLRGACDRVVMNLPYGAQLYLSAASTSLKPSGGIVHLYLFRKESQPLEERISSVTGELRSLGWKDVEVLFHRRIREIGPRTYNEVMDVRVS